MPRWLRLYVEILDDFLNDRATPEELRTRTLNQFARVDFGVWWDREWGQEVAEVLEQMGGDAEVYYPECPEQSYITLDELRQSCRANLRRLQDVLRERGSRRDGEPSA